MLQQCGHKTGVRRTISGNRIILYRSPLGIGLAQTPKTCMVRRKKTGTPSLTDAAKWSPPSGGCVNPKSYNFTQKRQKFPAILP